MAKRRRIKALGSSRFSRLFRFSKKNDEFAFGETNLEIVESKLGVKFKDKTLLVQALTHSSAVNEIGVEHSVSNERLEFLGDAVIGLVVAQRLFESGNRFTEGDLTNLRSQVVRGSTLQDAARRLCLGRFLILGKGERKSGGAKRASNLEDGFEALVGAVYLDLGFEIAFQVVTKWLSIPIREALTLGVTKDSKTALQHLIQTKCGEIPRYRVIDQSGPDDSSPIFVSEVFVGANSLGQGRGLSKSASERSAAAAALKKLEEQASRKTV